MNIIAETDFFHAIAPAIVALVTEVGTEMTIAENKSVAGDYSTQVDVDTENFIVSELEKAFPKDKVLAEEGYSATEIPTGRIWLIDPICGTNNLGKGVNNFCTNIALVDNKKVIAACVVDHSTGDYIWSVGEGKIFVNSDTYTPPSPELGQKVDVDFGAVRSTDRPTRKKFNNFLDTLVEETDFDIISLNASLGFAYAAIGKTDGFVNIFNHPWDIAAASFLVQQSGGVVTGLDGSDWEVDTIGAIGGRTAEVHQQLLNLYLHS